MKTKGVSPKVPVQAFTSVIMFALLYFNFELTPETSAYIAAVLGIIGGIVAPPGEVANAKKADGSINVVETANGKTYTLELDGAPEDIDQKNEVRFKVVKPNA